jgi:hypothetical protein
MNYGSFLFLCFFIYIILIWDSLLIQMIINFWSKDRFVFCQDQMSTRDKSTFNAVIQGVFILAPPKFD